LGASTGEVLGAETTCGIYVDKYLKKGLKSNDKVAVGKVQKFLNDYMTSGLVLDSIFGPKTEAALKAFQTKHADKILTPWKLTAPTGIFYLTTQTEVNNIMCPALALPIPSQLIPFSLNPLAPKV
jgi:peptidoglycan hydrolase-like protein with peptidoglycan-binding domain